MSVDFSQFASTNKAAVDSLLTIGSTFLSSVERATALNLNTLRDSISKTTANLCDLSSSKDPQAALAKQAALVQDSVQRLVAYNQSLFGFASEAQQELLSTFKGQAGGFKKSIETVVAQISKSAPAGSEVAVAALKQAVDTANSSYENMNKVAAQFSELVKDNASSVASVVSKAVNSAK